MSETDDTDALLTCDPGGGLHKLLESTMEDVSSQGDNKSPEKPSIPAIDPVAEPKEPKASIFKGAESSLDISDFFNSDGELVLSGLSKFSDKSVSISESEESEKKVSNSNNIKSKDEETDHENCVRRANHQSTSGDDADDDESGTETPCTVETLENNVGVSGSISKGNSIKNGRRRGGSDQEKIRNTESGEGSALGVTPVERKTVPREIQEDLQRQLVQANRSNPEIQDWLENHSSQISYGVLNLNLNDLKTFAEGLHRCDFFPRAPKVSTFVPTRNEKGEQIFTRAPNFRTKGGYKPPKNPPKCRDLTDDQIREEVRKMYAFPEAEDEKEGEADKSNGNCENCQKSVPEAKLEAKEKESTSAGNDTIKSKVQFNFLNDVSIMSEFEFGKGKTGKKMKRKLIPNEKLCGGTSGSIPDLGFGLRNIGSSIAREPMVVRTKAWVTGRSSVRQSESMEKINNDDGCQKSANGKVDGDKGQEKSKFSFGYGEEEDSLSPIRPLQERVDINSLQSARIESLGNSSETVTSTENRLENCTDLSSNSNTVTSSASDGIVLPKEDSVKKFSVALPVPLQSSFEKPPTPRRRPIRKAASKLKAMNSQRTANTRNAVGTSEVVLSDCVASDLEKILGELDLPAEEIESLIENLDEDDLDLAKTQFFEDMDDKGNLPDLSDAFSKLHLDAWRSNGSDNLSEKFQSEKFKREQCEKELRSLQESLMAEKQHTAVLEGTLKRRNLMLVQITMAFNKVCSEWTNFDQENRVTVNKLQRDQKILATACKRSRERISQYEKELHKTLELADSFKSKLTDLQKERDASVTMLKEANSELENKIQKLKEDMELLKNERDATLRALRESQIKLDEEKHAVENMESLIKTLEMKDLETAQKYDELLQVKSLQDSNLLEVVERKNELEALVTSLTTELNLEKSSKDKLKKSMQDEAERRSKAESERLHEYYNSKVQDILKSATEEAARSEAILKEQLKRERLESERKLSECKERFKKEFDNLRARYESEIEKLRKENLHRQLLISTTVKQLQMGESPNLDVNSLTTQRRIPQVSHKKTIFDCLNMQSNFESGDIYKSGSNGSSVSHLTKFTLDHLPSIISSQTQKVGGKESFSNFHDYVPFEAMGNLARFKTSTPIDPHSKGSPMQNYTTTDLPDSAGSGDYKKVNKAKSNNDDSSSIVSDKVGHENSANANNASTIPHLKLDLKNFLSHILETPVKPEKDQLQVIDNFIAGNHIEKPLDPELHKCIQDLLQCYAEKVQNNKFSDCPNRDSLMTYSENSKNENHCANTNTKNVSNVESIHPDCDEPESLPNSNSTSSESQASHGMSHNYGDSNNKPESRKPITSKADATSKVQQSTANLKPPWK